MDARRLLAQLTARLASAFRPSRRRDDEAAPSAAARGGSPPMSARANVRGMASWIEDGRRLRALPARRLRHGDTGRQAQPDILRVPAELERPRGGRGITRPAASLGTDAPSDAPMPQVVAAPSPAASTVPLQPLPALPPDILVDFSGDLSAATLEAIEGMNETQRRLIFLRYLVRQGVYNEGFGERRLPEQYWRSRGVDGPPPEN